MPNTKRLDAIRAELTACRETLKDLNIKTEVLGAENYEIRETIKLLEQRIDALHHLAQSIDVNRDIS